KEIMMSGFEVGGKKMYLYDFGIETMGYFNAAENEKNAYHIYGDEDDDAFKNETNKLMAMISSDPDAVVGFFTQLSQKLYDKMFDLMKGTEFSSVYKVYDNKKMQEEYDGYTTKIAEAEKKLQEYEDKWYKKFAAMETAMAKMQSNASAVTALLGGS
ncbi:MAG: flagellar filament capping protein FliD, partial [Lachnospiraceae bacterium]|nr:flagellar filament capping protein FliD [Lachnospiraceae bacterium]